MCLPLSLFKKKYYYRVYHHADNKHYYIMCVKCYRLLPAYLQKQHFDPSHTENFIFRFDDNKVLIEELIRNTNCAECSRLNASEFYETMNSIKPRYHRKN